ncbi:hypothetical protein [Leifsonia sp. Leaf264]|uniref:hypothetical protein n=1 Tax=Leifsonia sp. Leaf264 TaxID=1736314 RepID=UPI0006F619FC|nr:hypothetical protein [Leifsonia sp. Leaf264]KQO98175.1 hypothetical protein ASF30_08935 [Leifsonia sp. Leaf264]
MGTQTAPLTGNTRKDGFHSSDQQARSLDGTLGEKTQTPAFIYLAELNAASYTFDHEDGVSLHVKDAGEGWWTVTDGDHDIEFEYPYAYNEDLIEDAAKLAYDEKLIHEFSRRRGIVPSLDKLLSAEIDKVTARAKENPGGLSRPHDWNGEYQLSRASDRIGDRWDSDQLFKKADYADIGDEGITFGLSYPIDKLLGPAILGEKLPGEKDSDYLARIDAVEWATDDLETYFQATFEGTAIRRGEKGDVAVGFFVRYADAGPAVESVEGMLERAEEDTQLTGLKNIDHHILAAELRQHVQRRTEERAAAAAEIVPAKETTPGRVTVRKTRAQLRKATAPGELWARSDAAKILGVPTAKVAARISRQANDASWIEWECWVS